MKEIISGNKDTRTRPELAEVLGYVKSHATCGKFKDGSMWICPDQDFDLSIRSENDVDLRLLLTEAVTEIVKT